MSIGWRNPQEDAYDITSISINYTKDGSLFDAQCIDGYANGSISTQYFNPDKVKPYGTFKWDGYDMYNITMKEWTDNMHSVDQRADNSDTSYKVMQYRIGESQDCEIISKSVTDYPNKEQILDQRNKQTFKITYIKPFKVPDL